MRTIVILFFSSLFVALLLTPIVRSVSERLDLVDLPSGRKVHSQAISRVGGVAIYLAFFLCVGLSYYINSILTHELFHDPRTLYLFAGGLVMFLTGLIDDIRSLSARVKLLLQISAGTIVFLGGIKISTVILPLVGDVKFGIFSYPLTIFWFLVIINAINLIDGLDGLAAGVSFLVCIILAIFCAISKEFVVAAAFAGLSGAILGFLWYNFNPASIFMGDSGSYFIGYMIAALSLYGSIKAHTTVALSITALSLCVPLADTVVATLRRYMLGKKIFSPDKKHFHHQLLKRGFSHRNAVLILYGATVLFCLASLLTVYLSDKKSVLVFVVIGITIVAGVGKLGYLSHIDFRRFIRWTSDIQDGMGLTHDRRRFLAHQIAIHDAEDMDELRFRIEDALKMVDINYLKLELGGQGCNFRKFQDYIWVKNDEDKRQPSPGDVDRSLFITFPIEYEAYYFGRLTTSRASFGSSLETGVVLRRIELLRRTISRTLYDKKNITKYHLYDRRNGGDDGAIMNKLGIPDRRSGA